MAARLRDATADLAVDVELVELVELATAAAARRPLAILFSADVYAFDPHEFDALARSVGARRLLVEDGEPTERLEARLLGALREAPTSREEPREPEARESPKSSGVRWVAARDATVVKASSYAR
jgi:hypothetical protein